MPEYGSGGGYTVVMAGPFASSGGGTGKLTTISAPVANWKGGTSPYSQVVAMDDISANSKIDIQLSADQIELFRSQDIAFTVENRAGEVTLVAVGDKPSADCVFQATASEMLIVGDGGTSVICGNTVKTASFNNTGGKMEKDINMNGQSLFGLNAPTKDDEAATKGYADKLKNDTETYVNNAVRTAAPRNLLDNSDFRNPVNQRGETSYSGSGHHIDRWSVWHDGNGASLTINDGYISVSFGGHGNFNQRLPKGVLDPSKTYTVVVKHMGEDSPRIYHSLYHFEDDYDYVTVLASSSELEYAALYEGEYTEETLPEYRPKEYAVELAECQRYYRRSWTGAFSIDGIISFVQGAKTFSRPVVNWEIPMRGVPTITIYGWSNEHPTGYIGNWGTDEHIRVGIAYQSQHGFAINFPEEPPTSGELYAFHYEANAEL